MISKPQDLTRIENAIRDSVVFGHADAIVAGGDSLELLRQMPNSSVSLVLTDPPYHTTKKANIYGDTLFKEDSEFLHWMAEYAREWRRVLRDNGSLYVFCSSRMAARLEVLLSENFNILSHIVWTKPNEPGYDGWKGKMKKEALRQWYPHSERIIFAEPAIEGNLHRSPFALFLREARKTCGMSSNELAEITGSYGKVNHGGAVSNWETGRNIPSLKQYSRICDALIGTGRISFMPPYDEVIRVFRVDSSMEFTDVWTFPSVRPYKGKHPAEKPADLLEHVIEASSFRGDVVLDTFSGSGSTATAALSLGRKAVSIDIDPVWIERTADKVRRASQDADLQRASAPPLKIASLKKSREKRSEPQLMLFQAEGS